MDEWQVSLANAARALRRVGPRAGSPLFAQLQGEIERLAGLHAGPLFIPHVTVLGGMSLSREDAVSVLRQLARKVNVGAARPPCAPAHAHV